MHRCFLCKRQLSASDTHFDISRLIKERIAVPIRMEKNNVICEHCYVKLMNEYKQQQKPQKASNINANKGGLEVRGAEFHDKVLSPKEIKAMYERGPPGVADSTTHFIGHKDEKDGYLWIDGKKVKKDNPRDLK
jgi:hypothetical protein